MASTTAPSYWCQSCNGFVNVSSQSSITCLDCRGGFVEQRHPNPIPNQNFVRRNSRNHPEQSIFNPIIVLCRAIRGGGGSANYELYYRNFDSGMRPLSDSVAQLLLRTRFYHLLDQVTQLDVNDLEVFENTSAAKTAVESLPVSRLLIKVALLMNQIIMLCVGRRFFLRLKRDFNPFSYGFGVILFN